MKPDFKKKLIQCLKERFGEDLIAVVLFGSHARGDARADSDYDIFIVVKGLPKRPLERNSYVRKAVAFKFDERISIHAKTPEEFEKGFPPLYLDLAVDGKILYDTKNYMQKKLQRIQEIIKEAGLYRVKRNGYYVWEWKTQPGPHWSITWEGFHDRSR